jgi:hypothetical protein
VRGQGRPDSPLGVVLVCRRDPEHRENRIADELLSRPTEAHDLGVQELEELALNAPDVLGIELLAESRRAGQVGEEHGDDAPLLPLGERLRSRAAIRAEACVGGLFGAARGAGLHGSESMPRAWP